MDEIRGGYGRVVKLGGVAKKSIPRDLWESAIREIAFLLALRSSFVVRLYEFSFNEREIILTLEEATCDLTDWIERNPPLSARQEIEVQILAAVAFVHSQGVIHADIKPANLLVFDRGGVVTVKLCDFGISVPINERKHRGPLQTITYRAPEVPSEGPSDVSEKIDIWGIGCVLWFLYSGHNLMTYKKRIDDSAVQAAIFFHVSSTGSREAILNRLYHLKRQYVEARLIQTGLVDGVICHHISKFLMPDPAQRAPLGVKFDGSKPLVERRYLDDLKIIGALEIANPQFNVDNYSTILLSLADDILNRSGVSPVTAVELAACIYFTDEPAPKNTDDILSALIKLKGRLIS
jgi:serine/threonine protein kinase